MRLSIAWKLAIVSAVVFAILSGLAFAVFHFTRTTSVSTRHVYDEGVVKLLHAANLESILERHRRIVESAPAEVDLEKIRRDRKQLAELGNRLIGAVDLSQGGGQVAVGDLMVTVERVHSLIRLGEQTLEYAEHFALDKAYAHARDYELNAERLGEVLSAYRKQRVELVRSKIEDLAVNAGQLNYRIGAAAIVVLFLLLPLGVFVLRDVLRRLAAIRAAVQEVSSDRVNVKIPYLQEEDEVGELARALLQFQSNALELLEAKSNLAQQNAELARLSGSLEERVRQRTAEALGAAEFAKKASAELAQRVEEKTRVEHELRVANDKLLAATKAKSQFLANMSHEIRTPMNGILGMADLLQKTDLSKRQKHLTTVLSQSAKGLLEIINDILDVSRIEAGKLELNVHSFNVREVIEDTVELCATNAYRKGLEVCLIVPTELPATVNGDSLRLRQILTNLIGNAIKFTSTGEVVLRVEGTPASDGRIDIRFEVRDTGIGISQESQAKLFTPFEQADSSISRRFGGTGLGLVISRHLVNLMGGEIEVESELGSGTSIRFTLPFEVWQSEAAENSVKLRGKRILVVDDRASNREMMACCFSRCRATVERASSFDGAFEILEAAIEAGVPFDCVVMDRGAEKTGNIDMVRRIREDSRLANTVIVALMSMGWNGQDPLGSPSDTTIALSKPARRRELLQAIETALRARDEGMSMGDVVQAATVPPPSKSICARVLLAEDNPVNQMVALEYLAELECSVTTADDGWEAIEKFSSGTFDLILMDCQMPGLDGLAATQKIRDLCRETERRRVPIIAVTANAHDSDRFQALSAGMDDYLSKPFSADQLREIVARWHDAGASTLRENLCT